MFYRYRVHELDGCDAGEAHYAVLVEPGETIVLGAGRRVRVVDVIPVEEGDSPFVGLLRVEPLNAKIAEGDSSGPQPPR